MPGLTYSTYVTQIAEMAVVSADDANFQTIIPAMIQYAELRINRDLDLMSTSTSIHGDNLVISAGNRNLSLTDASGNNTIELPDGSGYFVVSEQLNIIMPAGRTNPDGAFSYRQPITPVTKEFLDAVYGSSQSANRGVPKYYSAFNETIFFVGPVPDQDYYVEIVGTFRPNPISSTNTKTFISQYLPDLFIMASMIYISAYQRNFGRQSDDPQMAQSYEAQYQALLKSAMVEEVRKKYEASAWSSQSSSPVATPTRG